MGDKMKKILLAVLVLFIMTGCSLDYNIILKDDLSIKEEFEASEPLNYFFEEYEFYDRDEIIDIFFERDKEKQPKVSYKKINNKDDTGAIISAEYKDLKDYLNRTTIYKQYFEKIEVSEESNIVSIESKGKFYPYVTQDFERYAIDDAKIKIKVPFKVIENNADEIEKDIYIWKIDKETKNKKIILRFDKKNNIKLNNEKNMTLTIVISVISIIIFVGLFIFAKLKNVDNSI